MQKLYKRLSSQLKQKGIDKKEAPYIAQALLKKRGHMKGNKLTPKGRQRQALGNKGRALDRQVKYRGGKKSDYTYNSKTNLVRKK